MLRLKQVAHNTMCLTKKAVTSAQKPKVTLSMLSIVREGGEGTEQKVQLHCKPAF